MKLDAYVEIYLWNRNIDALLRVLQRTEALGIRCSAVIKGHEVRLEELRAAFNADFTEAMLARECADRSRLRDQRAGLERTVAIDIARGSD